jgi:hypothetical protein
MRTAFFLIFMMPGFVHIVVAQKFNEQMKQLRFGVATGVGANGVLTYGNKGIAGTKYRTTIGSGLVIPAVYFIVEAGKADEGRFSARAGYIRSSANVAVSLDENQIDASLLAGFANAVNTRYLLNSAHIQVNRHFKSYVGKDSRNITSYVLGANLLHNFSNSAESMVQPIATMDFTSYPREKYSGAIVNRINFGGNIGWNYERQINENSSFVMGYVITAYLGDLTNQVSERVVPQKFSDGHN